MSIICREVVQKSTGLRQTLKRKEVDICVGGPIASGQKQIKTRS
jgi:hypothetical protein